MHDHNGSTLSEPTADRSPPARSVYDSVPLPLGDTMYIRVVKIRPSKVADASGRIVCDFSILDVEKGRLYGTDTDTTLLGGVKYTAISYTWGDTKADQTIELNGQPFLVRQNLRDFLDRARADKYTGYVWIDALCIDQSTVGERNHQVNLMGNIYSRAEQVVVWLGQVSQRLETAIKFCRSSRLISEPNRVLQQEYRAGVEEFCNAAYWSRAWIVQEFVLAKKTSIWYGLSKIEDEQLSYLFRDSWPSNYRVRLKSTPAMRIVTLREEWSTTSNKFGLDPARKIQYSGSEPQSAQFNDPVNRRLWQKNEEFSFLLQSIGRGMLCDDPRDRIFSLLSLLSDEGREQLSIAPDYSKSTLELFYAVLGSFDIINRSYQTYAEFLLVVNMVQEMLQLQGNHAAIQRAKKVRETLGRNFEAYLAQEVKLRVEGAR